MWQNYTNVCEKTDKTIQIDLTKLYKSVEQMDMIRQHMIMTRQHYTNSCDKTMQMDVTSLQMDVTRL